MDTNSPRKPRFVLIDPSAIHTGGHHYEYAARILKIAAQQGYAPELWAHKTSQLPQDDFPVRTLIRNSFYANFSRPLGAVLLKKLKDQSGLHDIVTDIMQRVRKRISDRMLPFFLESRAGLDASRAWHDARFGQYNPTYDSPQNKLKTGALSYSFYFLFFKVIGVIKRTVKEPGFKQAAYVFVFLIALLLLLLGWAGLATGAGAPFLAGLVVAAGLMAYHYTLIRERDRPRCFKAFLHNNWVGGAIFAGWVADYLLR